MPTPSRPCHWRYPTPRKRVESFFSDTDPALRNYKYKAVDDSGKRVLGEISAANSMDLEMRLDHMGLDLISFQPVRANSFSLRLGRVKRSDIINFCFQMEQLLAAGIPLLEGLEQVRDGASNPRWRNTLAALMEEIEGGAVLSVALSRFPKVFNQVFCSLVRAGEESGKLAEVFKDLTETLKWQDELIAQTKKILMYPAFVGVVVVSVLFFLMIYLVPQLVNFLENMGGELPIHTRALIAISAFFADYWYAILATPFVCVALLHFGTRYVPSFRYFLDGLKLRIWLVGPILREIILARFARFFGLMYNAGVNVVDCLRISEKILGNVTLCSAMERVVRQVEQGQGLSRSFQNANIFPPLVISMLRVGETTGALETALLNVSYFYDRHVKEGIERVERMLEPALTVVLGLLLGWIMISVLGPVYDLITQLT